MLKTVKFSESGAKPANELQSSLDQPKPEAK